MNFESWTGSSVVKVQFMYDFDLDAVWGVLYNQQTQYIYQNILY